MENVEYYEIENVNKGSKNKRALLMFSFGCISILSFLAILVSAALTLGINSGFVADAPINDPLGAATNTADYFSSATGDTSPETATRIVEIGWWANVDSEEANFEVGLYSDNSSTPGSLLYSERTNAKGTTSGWKTVAVDWDIEPSTDYWIAVQCDNTATTTTIDTTLSPGGQGFDRVSSSSTLPDDFNGGALYDADGMMAIYAVWDEGGEPPTECWYVADGNCWLPPNCNVTFSEFLEACWT